MRNQKTIFWLVLVAVIVLIGLGVWWISSLKGSQPNQDNNQQASTTDSGNDQNGQTGRPNTVTQTPTTNDPKGIRGTYIDYIVLGSGKTVILQLAGDTKNSATLTEDMFNDNPATYSTGTWSQPNPETVLVTLTKENGKDIVDKVLSFKISSAGALSLEQGNVERWGSGLSVSRAEIPLDTSWSWNDDKQFVLSLQSTGRATATGDCNTMSGSYHLEDKNQIQISMYASTEKSCSGSKEEGFMSMLGQAVTYSVSGNTLTLTFKDGSKEAFTRK